MKQSESIANLAAALVAVQDHITPVARDRTNSHFGNSYATLDSIMESVRMPLAGQGLAIVQGGAGPITNVDGNLCGVTVETLLVHVSGEYLSSIIALPLDKPSAQAVGSAVTYGRRYGVSALLSLTTDEDDDGHVATANAANRAGNGAGVAPVGKPAGSVQTAAAPRSTPLAGGVPLCPKCGGAMWDNRADNDKRLAEGKKLRPDWGCKNAPKGRGEPGCIGVIWRPDPKDEPELAGEWTPEHPQPGYEAEKVPF